MALPHFVVQKVSQADFLQGSLYPFTESYPSHLEEQLGRYMGLVMSSEMSGWVFLKPSQRGKIFREFVYCQRFRCVQNKSLDASETASFGPLTFMTQASTQGPNGMESRSNLGQLVLTVGRYNDEASGL